MNTLQIGNVTVSGILALGPMAGITDTVYRQLCKEQGCSLLYSEMVSAKAVLYKNRNTAPLLAAEDQNIRLPCSSLAVTRILWQKSPHSWKMVHTISSM